MDLGLNGKTALITGGASGIGHATAKVLMAEGASVILVDPEGPAVSDAAGELGDGAHALQTDLTDPKQMHGLRESVRERFEMPDILVCAAGVTGTRSHPLKLGDADWQERWDRDFLSVVRTIRLFVPTMEERGWGRAVVIASEKAVQPYADEALCNVAKAALLEFSRGLARSCAPNGVLINAVSPAIIENDVNREEATGRFTDEAQPDLELARRGNPEKVAAAVAFLCSEKASFVAGANSRIDGGAAASMAL